MSVEGNGEAGRYQQLKNFSLPQHRSIPLLMMHSVTTLPIFLFGLNPWVNLSWSDCKLSESELSTCWAL